MASKEDFIFSISGVKQESLIFSTSLPVLLVSFSSLYVCLITVILVGCELASHCDFSSEFPNDH